MSVGRDRVVRGGDVVSVGGDRLVRGGEVVSVGGDRVVRGGEAPFRGGDGVFRGDEDAFRGDEDAFRGDDDAFRVRYGAFRARQAASRVRDLASGVREAVSAARDRALGGDALSLPGRDHARSVFGLRLVAGVGALEWLEMPSERIEARADVRPWVTEIGYARAEGERVRAEAYAPRAEASILVRWNARQGAVVSVLRPLTRARRKSFAAPSLTWLPSSA